ncbi:MAG: hypothetical protein ABUT39_15135 [Acidobacteriota bacterium]
MKSPFHPRHRGCKGPRSSEFRLGPALQITQLLALTYQQVGGRLLADEVHEDYRSTAVALLRGKDRKTLKVRVAEG